MNNWLKHAVVYQVYPKSFMDANGDGIGDLPGVVSRLNYLRELGVDVIWLNPIYSHSGVDGGYDIRDYRRIAPEFGTMEDFDTLLREAHARDMRIVLDLVVNHTSTEHAWFQASRRGKDDPKRDYYIWRPPYEGGVPNGLRSYFSGPAWERDGEDYYLHMFAREQADLNWRNPQVREGVYAMMRWWLDKGVDGFRMDVINLIGKPEEALRSDGAPDQDVGNGPLVAQYLREMNREVLSHYDIMTVGETGGVQPHHALDYAPLTGEALDMVFQFEHMDVDSAPSGKWDVVPLSLPKLKAVFARWQESLHGRAWNSLYWNNHDQPRIVSRFGCDADEESRVRSAKMLGLCLHMMQGTPYIYQGEELGMTNCPLADIGDCLDVEAINAYRELVVERGEKSPEAMMDAIRRKGRDNARTPMQWTAGRNAGFTDGTPWMPVNPNHTHINAQEQVNDPDSVFSFYKRLIALRRTHPVIVEGDFTLLMPQDGQVFAYRRGYEGRTLTVQCNFSAGAAALSGDAQAHGELLIGNYEDAGEAAVLRPWEARAVLS